MLLPPQHGWWLEGEEVPVGEVVREVMWSPLFHLIWSVGVSWSIWSQMCGNWYFLMFLSSEGSLTLTTSASLGSIPCRGATPILSPNLPNTTAHPLPPGFPYFCGTILGKYPICIYLFSLTFSPGPDEAATVWWLWKPVLNKCDNHFVSAIRRY